MIIVIEGKQYIIKVKETFMDENKEHKEEILELDKWVEIVRKKAISTLYYYEDELSKLLGRPIKLSDDYPQMKKPILNLSGCVSRLSENLIITPLNKGGDED